MANSNNRQVVPEAKAALNQMKLEIANELGMANYDAVCGCYDDSRNDTRSDCH